MNGPKNVVRELSIPFGSLQMKAYIIPSKAGGYGVDLRYPDGTVAAGTLGIRNDYETADEAETATHIWFESLRGRKVYRVA